MVPKSQLKNIDIINVFRPSDELEDIIKQIIQLKELKRPVIWSQIGISDKKAEEIAIKNNMKIIMNKCIKIEHANIN
jgi:predicted CoA-binding protein